MRGAAKTQADTFQPFDDAAIEIQAESVTDENGQSTWLGEQVRRNELSNQGTSVSR